MTQVQRAKGIMGTDVVVTSQILELRKTYFYQTQNSEPTKTF